MRKQTNLKIKICGKCTEKVVSKNWSRRWRRKHECITPYEAVHAPIETNDIDDMAGFGQQPILTP